MAQIDLRVSFMPIPGLIALYKENPFVVTNVNWHRLPLLNIGGATGNNLTLSIAVCFLSGCTEEDYDEGEKTCFL